MESWATNKFILPIYFLSLTFWHFLEIYMTKIRGIFQQPSVLRISPRFQDSILFGLITTCFHPVNQSFNHLCTSPSIPCDLTFPSNAIRGTCQMLYETLYKWHQLLYFHHTWFYHTRNQNDFSGANDFIKKHIDNHRSSERFIILTQAITKYTKLYLAKRESLRISKAKTRAFNFNHSINNLVINQLQRFKAKPNAETNIRNLYTYGSLL